MQCLGAASAEQYECDTSGIHVRYIKQYEWDLHWKGCCVIVPLSQIVLCMLQSCLHQDIWDRAHTQLASTDVEYEPSFCMYCFTNLFMFHAGLPKAHCLLIEG